MARGRKTSLEVDVSADERRELESWQRSTTMRAGLVRRGRIVLLRAQGLSISDISRSVGMRRRHVAKWVTRFIAEGIDGLQDKRGRGRKPFFPSRPGHAPRQDGLRKAG